MKRKILGITLLSAMTLCTAISLSACGGQDAPIVNPEFKNVTWNGTDDIELNMGDTLPDFLAGVTAKTDSGKELTVKIDAEASDEVRTDVDGSFTIWYVAYDGDTLVSEEKGGSISRTINVNRGTFIEDNDFKTGEKFKWAGNGNAGSEMTWTMDKATESIKVDIKKSGQEFWQNQVEFNGLNVKANTTYEITIRAKSTTGRNIGASLEVPAQGYRLIEDNSTNVVGYKTSTEYQDFKYYYTASEDFDGVKFGITLGRFNEDDDAPSVVNIDKVEIKALDKVANTTGIVFENAEEVVYKIGSYQDFLDIPAVTAKDAKGNPVELIKEGAVQKGEFADDLAKATFGEMYKYVDAEGNLSYVRRQFNYAPVAKRDFEHSTLDGQFMSGSKFWNKEENDLVTITDNKADNTVTIAAAKDKGADADWKAQLQQNNIDGQILRAGIGYKAVVRAKTTNKDVKTLRLEFCFGAGHQEKTDLIFDANNEYQVFESTIFTPTQDVTGGALRTGLLVGEYAARYELTVDYIDIVEVAPAREFEHSTNDGEFTRGTHFWTKEENGFIEITDNRADHTVTIKATKNEPTKEPDWKAQLQQNNVPGAKLTAGKKYKAVTRAKTTNKDIKTLRLEFCFGAGHKDKTDLIFNANNEYQVFESTIYTPDRDITGGDLRVGLLLAEYSAAYELTVDYIQIVEVK